MDLSRAEALVGKVKMGRLKDARVAVVGLGGVGSYIVEGLCRSGVGSLLLVDGDVYVSSNLNRQLGATMATVGRSKVQVTLERVRSINPECWVQVYSEFYRPGDFGQVFAGRVDFVADAIDDTAAKADLLTECCRLGMPVISVMGTGNKLHPELLQVTDISKTQVCPLARSMRQRLRQAGIVSGVEVVYSPEVPQRAEHGACSAPASMIFVPAAAGLLAASRIVQRLMGE